MFVFNFNNKKNNDKKSIKVSEINQLIGKISLIDIREPYEYSYGHLSTAKNIPMNNILGNPDAYLDKNQEYYIICQSGRRSDATCKVLIKQGYNVINVEGGTTGYKGRLEY